MEHLKKARAEYRTIAINQLSLTNNLLLTICVGLLTFGFNKDELIDISFSLSHKIDFNKSLLIFFILSTFISILLGVAVTFSRLMDFRLTRYILGIRIKIYHKHQINLGYETLNKTHKNNLFSTFRKLLNDKHVRFSEEEILNFKTNEDNFKTRFSALRKTSQDIGQASILWTKYQGFFFLIAVVFFILHLFTNTV